MEELKAIRALLAPVARLDDPTVGLTALHGEVTQSRLKVLETVQGGVTGLREENRELRRRQDRMISDLNDTRGELRQLLELAVTLRPLAEVQTLADEPEPDVEAGAPVSMAPEAPERSLEPGDDPAATAAQPSSSDTDSQRGTMESNQQQPQPEPEPERRDWGQDDALKHAIQAAYQGNSTPAAHSSAPAPTGGEDPRVNHGVLLLKAAGVASVDLVAHRDTWEWLTALAVDHDHFRTPPSVEDVKEGRPDRPVRPFPHRSAHQTVGHPIRSHPTGSRLGAGHDRLQPDRRRTHRRQWRRPDHPHRPGRRTPPRDRRLTSSLRTGRR
ncbi:hypothetical protein [Streptomyces microflavus]|uniref:hypothetical protein n=1 Tax=Streptomyces microflavus TaxID=1919 RepID=UPI0033E6A176